MADRVTALAQAPLGEAYDGPMLFEAPAAAQLFGQLLGDNLKVTRKPIADPGRAVPYVPSELENRIGSRILPEWMDVVDDPTQTQWHGQTLLGHYLYDMEGVAAQPLHAGGQGHAQEFSIDAHAGFQGLPGSNGHARLPGSFGARAPGFGNLFIRSSQTTPAADMKQKLIDLCHAAQQALRDSDPEAGLSIVGFDRRTRGGCCRLPAERTSVAPPLLAYKVYPDGREELVRGVRVPRTCPRARLKDIVAASDESYVFDFIDSNAPFALMGAGIVHHDCVGDRAGGAVRRIGTGAGSGRSCRSRRSCRRLRSQLSSPSAAPKPRRKR